MQLTAGTPGQKVAGRAGLAGILVAGVLAVTFGTGYTATRALSDNGSVWLRKGDSIAQINAPARRVQATVGGQLVASPSAPLTISQLPDGTVFVATPGTNQVRRINQSTEQAGPPVPGNGVVSGDGHVWAVETAQGQVLPLDPTTGQPSGKPVSVGAPIRSSAVAGGVVYVTTTSGTVVAVSPSGKRQTTKAGQPGDLLVIAVAGGTPYVVDETSGMVSPAAGGQGIHLPGRNGSSLEVAPVQPGPDVWLVRGNQLVDVQVDSGDAPSTQLTAHHTYEAPVVMGDQVYVPDVTAGRVDVYDAESLQLIKSYAVPAGAPGDPGGIEVVAKEGAVWVDEPSSQDALALTNGGATSETVDKGTGKGVVNPNKPTTTKKPTSGPGATTNTPAPPTDTNPVMATDPGTTPTPPSSGTPVGTSTPPPTDTDTTATTPTTGSTTTSTTAPPGKTVTVPDVSGKAMTADVSDPSNAACAAITAAGLTCKADDLGKAPNASTTDDVAVKQDPAGGTSAQADSSVTVSFYSAPADVALPNEVGNTDYTTACDPVRAAGFMCTANPASVPAPGGHQKGEVATEDPDPSSNSTAPAGSTVTLTYYTGLTQVAVPDCRSEATNNLTCAPTDGSLQIKAVEVSTAADVACNTVYAQTVPPTQTVDWGSEVDVDFDAACATTVQQASGSWADNPNPKNTNNKVWWVGRSDEAVPSGFTAQSQLIGYIYENAEPDGSAKPGTVPLYRYQYGSYPDYYTTTNGSFSHPGWGSAQVIGYVYAPGAQAPAPYQYAAGVPDSKPIYAASYDTDPKDAPGEYRYSESTSSYGSGAQTTPTVYWVSP